MSDANFFSSKIVLFYKRFTSKFKQIFYFYKTAHGSVYSKVLGEVLVFAVHFQHCDIVSVHHTRNQKKYWRAQIPTLQKEMRSLQTINQNNTSIHLFNTNILLCLTWMFMLRLVFFFIKCIFAYSLSLSKVVF